MGDDAAIVQAARVSYGEGTKTIEEDSGLIRYLMRMKHTSPFEQVEFKFHVKAPIFVFRQWQRHRAASMNEHSFRYTEAKDECYIPDIKDLRLQSKNNKQCRDEATMEDEVANKILSEMKFFQKAAFEHYGELIETGLAREVARIDLPVTVYSEMYWKIDLHNLLHFLKLRTDKHAQLEIRVFAEAMYELIKPIVPVACKAFDDYILNSITLSKQEKEMFIELLKEEGVREILLTKLDGLKISKREKSELKVKLELEE
jgi:thymidylate synthase (FAD)